MKSRLFIFLVILFLTWKTGELPCQELGEVAGTASEAPSPGYLGFRAHFEAVKNGDRGIRVLSLAPGSPAEQAGLASDDLIVAVNGERLDFDNDLEMVQYLRRFNEGDRLSLEVSRAGRTSFVMLTCGALPEDRVQAAAQWLKEAEERVNRGLDIYSCDEQDLRPESNNDPSKAIWEQFLRSVSSDLEISIARDQSGELSLHADRQERVPSNLSIDFLPLEIQALAKALKPGDSMKVVFSFDPEMRQWAVRLEDQPDYLGEILESMRPAGSGQG